MSILVSLALGLPGVGFARAQPDLHRELRALLSALPHPDARAGACVIDLKTGKTVFASGADTPLVPASTMKVFVMAAAMQVLGTDFSFETVFATDGRDLVVIGDGDPALGDERIYRGRNEPVTVDLQRCADALAARGIRSIPGDLVIDESIFDGQWVHPSWEEGDLGNWYAAPVGGLNFNDNCVDITVRPAEQLDAPVLVSIIPETSLATIVNQCRSGGTGRPILHHPSGSFKYKITGRCTKRWPFASVSFPDPGLLCADALRTVLAHNGIRVEGQIRRRRVRDAAGGRLPGSMMVLVRRETPLTDVLRRVGKDSQNLFAECLLKRTGYAWAERNGRPDPQGSWNFGREAVIASLEPTGVDLRGFVVADGSGLSRDSACTARQLAAVLTWLLDRPSGPVFLESLSVAGVDGSLRKRLTDGSGRVCGKTGTMRGVRALAGYVDADTGAGYAFAVMFNGYNGTSEPYKGVQDRFCRVLMAQDGPSAGGR